MSHDNQQLPPIAYIMMVYVGPLFMAGIIFYVLAYILQVNIEYAIGGALLAGGADYFLMRFVTSKMKLK